MLLPHSDLKMELHEDVDIVPICKSVGSIFETSLGLILLRLSQRKLNKVSYSQRNCFFLSSVEFLWLLYRILFTECTVFLVYLLIHQLTRHGWVELCLLSPRLSGLSGSVSTRRCQKTFANMRNDVDVLWQEFLQSTDSICLHAGPTGADSPLLFHPNIV